MVNVGAVVGGVFGGLSFLLLAAALVLLILGLLFRKKKQPHDYAMMSSLDASMYL